MRIPGLSRTAQFRTRSSERERQDDSLAVTKIVDALAEALDGCEREIRGLSQRLETAKAGASFLAGSGVDEHLDREPKDADQLRELERQMAAAESRIGTLTNRLTRLKLVNATLAVQFPEAISTT